MSSSNCLNCGATLDYQVRFCPDCGQKTNTHRLTPGHIFHDFFHALSHADKGILYLLRALALKPGIVAQAVFLAVGDCFTAVGSKVFQAR